MNTKVSGHTIDYNNLSKTSLHIYSFNKLPDYGMKKKANKNLHTKVVRLKNYIKDIIVLSKSNFLNIRHLNHDIAAFKSGGES